MPKHPLQERANNLIAAVNPKHCHCGSDRKPRSVIRGSLSLTVCDGCGGLTTPKEK